MNPALRLPLAFVAACGVTLGLFVLMNYITSSGNQRLESSSNPFTIDFVRLQRETPPQVRQREIPQKPPPPKEPPPPPRLEVESVEQPNPQQVDLNLPNLNVSGLQGGAGPWVGSFSGTGTGAIAPDENSELVPLIRMQPQYPQKAALDGIQGSVLLELVIRPDGTVADARAVEFTDRIFVSPTLRAVYRWKFRPKIVNGEPVETTGRYTMVFALSDN
jgi:periplasmic protein TonB